MQTLNFQRGGQPITLNTLSVMNNYSIGGIQALAHSIGGADTNVILSGCSYTHSGAVNGYYSYNFTDGYVYSKVLQQMIYCPANNFTTTVPPASFANQLQLYYSALPDPQGEVIMKNGSSANPPVITDFYGKWFTPDQSVSGLVSLGYYSGFNTSIPDTYYSKPAIGNLLNNLQNSVDDQIAGVNTSISNINYDIYTIGQNVSALQSRAQIPTGLICMWSGLVVNIPSGWYLCNGANGTPDLSGRFIVGYTASDSDYTTVRGTGGEKFHMLSTAELPAHSHQVVVQTKSGNGYYGVPSYISGEYDASRTINQVTIMSNLTGSNGSHENRPPYMVLAYIMKA